MVKRTTDSALPIANAIDRSFTLRGKAVPMSVRGSKPHPMTMVAEPILYSFRRCPYAIRARVALAISETHYVLREVRLARKPAAMLQVSPKGTIPVLVLGDGTVVEESIQIMRWALARNDPEGWLERDDPVLIGRNDGPFKHDLDRYKYSQRYGSDPITHRHRGMEFLRLLETRLSGHAHLCASKRGTADCGVR